MFEPGVLQFQLRAFSAICLLLVYGCFAEFESLQWSRPERLSSSATLIDYVDPFIGTSGVWWASGHTSPAATRPFGMVKLGPDSSILGKTLSHSGYAKNDPELVGFSLTRYSGTGVGEGGILRVKPLPRSAMSFSEIDKKRYVIDKRTEMARPGYYSVYLHAQKTKVELTSSVRAGVHRYEYETQNPVIAIELSSAHKGKLENVQITSITPDGFEGNGLLRAGFSDRYKGLPVFFAAKLSHNILSHRFIKKDQVSSAATFDSPGDDKSFFEISVDAPALTAITLKIGLSYTNIAAARTHLGEVTALTFEDVRESAEDAWQSVLEKIQVEGGSVKEKKIFYSALYRSFLMPTQFGDADFSYYGGDKSVHAGTHQYYSDFSLWDTFRTVHPLFTLIAKDEHVDMLKSLMLIYEQTGYLTRWFSGAGHTGSMLGVPSVIALSEAYQKGLLDVGFDLNQVMTAMTEALDSSVATKGKECLKDYTSLGYCPSPRKGSVSYTLEYAYGDSSLALFAEGRGDSAVASFHRSRAQSAIQKQFDKRFLAFLPKNSNGDFEDLGPQGPSWEDSSYLMLGKTGKAFIEGGARHWRFYSFFETDLSKQLFGSNLEPILDEFFENAKPALGSIFPPYFYWHGNEPDFFAPYVYALDGHLSKTQKWVSWILTNKYSDKSNGLDGDDDAGTLSAWYVFSAMGFFPIAGTDRYVLGVPVFDRITVDMGGGHELVVTKSGSKTTKVYLDGSKLETNEFTHSDIATGATLSFGGPGAL